MLSGDCMRTEKQVNFAKYMLSVLDKVRRKRCNSDLFGRVAQSVEQRIENPRVGGSIPPPATKDLFQAVPYSPESPYRPQPVRAFLFHAVPPCTTEAHTFVCIIVGIPEITIGRVVFLVWTERGDEAHLISCRYGDKHETRAYFKALGF